MGEEIGANLSYLIAVKPFFRQHPAMGKAGAPDDAE
jgi:hypothetical protein